MRKTRKENQTSHKVREAAGNMAKKAGNAAESAGHMAGTAGKAAVGTVRRILLGIWHFIRRMFLFVRDNRSKGGRRRRKDVWQADRETLRARERLRAGAEAGSRARKTGQRKTQTHFRRTDECREILLRTVCTGGPDSPGLSGNSARTVFPVSDRSGPGADHTGGIRSVGIGVRIVRHRACRIRRYGAFAQFCIQKKEQDIRQYAVYRRIREG